MSAAPQHVKRAFDGSTILATDGPFEGCYFEGCIIDAPPHIFTACCFTGCAFIRERPSGSNVIHDSPA